MADIRPASNERGGITLFLLVMLIALIVVSATLTDIVHSRIAAAEAEADARRAGRSILSRYEPALLAYGLFGTVGDKEGAEAAIQSLKEAKLAERIDGRFRLYETLLQENTTFSAEPLYHLGDHRIFHRQILERMKYIAVIEFGLEIAQKFSKGKTEIAKAQKYAKLSQELETLLLRRQDALDAAWVTSQAAASLALSEAGTGSMQAAMDRVHGRLTVAEQANDDIRKQLSAPVSEASSPETPYPHISVLPSTYFSAYRSGVGTIASLHSAWQAAISSQQPLDDPVEDSEEQKRQREERRERLLHYTNEWLAKKGAEESKRKQEEDAVREQQKNHKRAAEEEINKQRDQWNNVCLDGNAGEYLVLAGPEGLYEKYKTYNEHVTSGGILADMQEDSAEAFLSAALKLTSEISQLASEARDEIYINEYVLTHFTYRTYDKQKPVVAVKTGIGNQESHRLLEQEAEYILYGLPSCQMNVTAMQAELFVFRTGLRTMEALLRPGPAAGAASPMAALLAALAKGTQEANRDTATLLAGEGVELPFVPGVTMDYKDHLRLFYLLHSRDESILSRLQALIELNTGIDLMKRYTSIRVRTTSETIGWVLRLPPMEAEVVTSY